MFTWPFWPVACLFQLLLLSPDSDVTDAVTSPARGWKTLALALTGEAARFPADSEDGA
jgi:hypothetical protein